MVHQKKPQRMLRLFCCTIPSGTDSHFAQALVFVSRGLVAKNGCGFVKQGPRLSVSESGERTMYAARGVQPHERFCKAKWRPYRPTSEPD